MLIIADSFIHFLCDSCRLKTKVVVVLMVFSTARVSAFSGAVFRVHQHHGEPPIRSTSVGGAGAVPAGVCPAG